MLSLYANSMQEPKDHPLTKTLDVLKHRHRRYVLYHLKAEPGPVDTDALVDRIVRWEATDPGIDETDREAVEIGLRHTHLPKLTSAGVVTVSPNPGVVSLAETGLIDRFLEPLAEIDGRSVPTAADSRGS